MLKFSGFANLTSCLEGLLERARASVESRLGVAATELRCYSSSRQSTRPHRHTEPARARKRLARLGSCGGAMYLVPHERPQTYLLPQVAIECSGGVRVLRHDSQSMSGVFEKPSSRENKM